ncbi:hypothetical protein NA57DRAFT_77314 [Rhizodiscina lignyota]|uniref:ASX DEUBAD domain-containing protein n=1 Tax=Rhizodiscina lignyota TaxID=1504668 RepID=A0A9P4M3T6_9PEZI|nr:hypothetical protein NA57DRAFT_77314 [Rhizodiscina lignyota]
MSAQKQSRESSPLSSVPSRVDTPSPTGLRSQLDTMESTAQSSAKGFDSDVEDEWDDDVFTDDLAKTASAAADIMTDKAPIPDIDGADDGFAEQDIARAIAESLGQGHTSAGEASNTNSKKRALSIPSVDQPLDAPVVSSSKIRSIDPRPISKVAKTRKVTSLTTWEHSPVAKVKLHKMLRSPRAWRSLTLPQQQSLAKKLQNNPPVVSTNGHSTHNVMLDALMSNDSLRTDVREWQEGLAHGFEDPEWIRQASVAMEKRARGELGSGIWGEEDDEKEEEGEEENAVVGEGREAWWKDPNLK